MGEYEVRALELVTEFRDTQIESHRENIVHLIVEDVDLAVIEAILRLAAKGMEAE